MRTSVRAWALRSRLSRERNWSVTPRGMGGTSGVAGAVEPGREDSVDALQVGLHAAHVGGLHLQRDGVGVEEAPVGDGRDPGEGLKDLAFASWQGLKEEKAAAHVHPSDPWALRQGLWAFAFGTPADLPGPWQENLDKHAHGVRG